MAAGVWIVGGSLLVLHAALQYQMDHAQGLLPVEGEVAHALPASAAVPNLLTHSVSCPGHRQLLHEQQ